MLASLPEEERAAAINSLTNEQANQVLYDWRGFWARPKQIRPDGEWRYWLVLAGRGFGKTRVGAETVREWAEDPNARILMIAPVAADVREVMIEGESGLMQCYPPDCRPVYNPSRHLVTFPSGAIGITRSADEPERLRGPQFTKFWADELCAWRYVEEAWSQIMFGFRLPTEKLQGAITTTPKNIEVLQKLVDHPKTHLTHGTSYENRSNLSQAYYEDVIAPYEGTELGRQELYAEILKDVKGALWKQRVIDSLRIQLHDVRWDLLVRIVVAIDPAVTNTTKSDETGIVVAALTTTSHVIVLDDLSLRGSSKEWATIAVNAYASRGADVLVGEVNNGGDLVEDCIRAVDGGVHYRSVRASRGKIKRAEPVAALYERGRVHHVGHFPDLEKQMCTFVPGVETKHDDRADALVWAITELVIDPEPRKVKQVYNPLGDYRISPV